MRIYVASSWRNEVQPFVVERLRAEGHEVYDFRNPVEGDNGFAWSEIDPNWKNWTAEEYVAAMKHPAAERGFKFDMDALRNCEACVLVQPCGVSASMEFGWACGAGRLCLVLVPGIREPDLMLKMGDALCLTLDEVVTRLRGSPETSPAHGIDRETARRILENPPPGIAEALSALTEEPAAGAGTCKEHGLNWNGDCAACGDF